MYQNVAYYFEESAKIYLIDDASDDVVEEPMRLPLVETFGIVRDFEEADETRKLNTFYVWYKANQEVFKGEITISGPVGWEGDNFTFVGLGTTEENCIADMIVQFSTGREIVKLED